MGYLGNTVHLGSFRGGFNYQNCAFASFLDAPRRCNQRAHTNQTMTRIYHSPYPPLSVPTNKSVSQFLLECNPDDVEPTKTIVEDFDSYSNALTYGSLRKNASQCAYALRHQLGLKAGGTVCIVAKNSVNWVLLAHAVMWAGGCFRYVSTRFLRRLSKRCQIMFHPFDGECR